MGTKIIILVLLVAFISCSKDEKKSGEITTLSGLKYTDIVVGTGPTPTPGQNVTIHYTGYLLDGKKFDSSRDRYQPYTFTIGVGQSLMGWNEGIISMKTGGKRKLIIPSELAYGERGVKGSIPPNSIVVFEVELLNISQPD